MYETPNYTEINVIENYAPTAKAVITVADAGGNPVEGAKVCLLYTSPSPRD